jgi:hypothetical protein
MRSTTVSEVPSATPISGKRFAYNHLTLDERAQAGAEIYEQHRPVTGLTMKQVSAVVGVSAADINRRRSTRRPKRPSLTLAKHIARSTPAERANARAELGDDFIFAAFFEPQLPL